MQIENQLTQSPISSLDGPYPYRKQNIQRNNLFPVFLELEKYQVLIIGGGETAFERLRAIRHNTPNVNVRLIARSIELKTKDFLEKHQIPYIEKTFREQDAEGIKFVIIAINDRKTSLSIYQSCHQRGSLVCVVDVPECCDFYMSPVVQKGHLKLAISTNGKSPAIARRIKSVLNASIPEEINDVLQNMEKIRYRISGDFSDKVKQLNDITALLAVKTQPETKSRKKIITTLIFIFSGLGVITTSFLLGRYLTFENVDKLANWLGNNVTSEIFIFILGGFLAQLIDGALGMAYGVSVTTFLLSFGISPAAASASVHTAEIFTSGASGLMHLRFGNVNTKLFKKLVIPGVVGAVLGAYILSSLEEYDYILKPIISCYTLLLGIVIIRNVFINRKDKKKFKRIGWLASFGGFIDSIGGGGWGPIVTSTLIAGGRHPRYTIGSVNLTEFFVTLSSATTFILMIGLGHFQIIIGLVIGGCIAAPLGATFTSRLPVKTIMLIVGILITLLSLRTILKTIWF